MYLSQQSCFQTSAIAFLDTTVPEKPLPSTSAPDTVRAISISLTRDNRIYIGYKTKFCKGLITSANCSNMQHAFFLGNNDVLMMTSMLSMSSGDAYMYGVSVRDEPDRTRRMFGVCPTPETSERSSVNNMICSGVMVPAQAGDR